MSQPRSRLQAADAPPPDIDALIYGRVSEGLGNSVDEQIAEGERDCQSKGWAIAGRYEDRRKSASRYATTTRGDWARLCADVAAGTGNLVWLWESSRGSRELVEWATFLKMCRARGVLIYVHTHHRAYDVAGTPRDWETLATDGVRNASYSDETRDRILRNMEANAGKGRPHGRVRYGYRRVYDDKRPVLIAEEADPGQWPVVARIIRAHNSGTPGKAIAAQLNADAILSLNGGPWTRHMVRRIGLCREYGGARPWDGEAIPSAGYPGTRFWDGEEIPAIWPALVTREESLACYDRLTSELRTTTRPGGRKHLASYHARCASCGGHLGAKPAASNGRYRVSSRYRCERGCCSCGVAPLDAYLRQLTLWVIGEGGVTTDDGLEARAADADIQRLEGLLEQYAAQAAAEEITPQQMRVITAKLTGRLAEARTRAAASRRPPVPFKTAGEWDAAPVYLRREALTVALGEIELLPAPPGRRPPPGTLDASRVRVTWTSAGGLVDLVIWPGHEDEAAAMIGQKFRRPWL